MNYRVGYTAQPLWLKLPQRRILTSSARGCSELYSTEQSQKKLLPCPLVPQNYTLAILTEPKGRQITAN